MLRRHPGVSRVPAVTPFLSASILSPLEHVLRNVLEFLGPDQLGLSWAWSIIALTVVVRLIILPITAKQTRSSLAMQRLSPYIKQLQQKHKDDRVALNESMMEFYRDNKVNPLASCFPLLIQIPVFLSLFFVLKHFGDVAHTGDNFSFLFGFVDDIRQQINNDKGSIPANMTGVGWFLLVVYIGSQMLSTVTMMTSQNPQQKYMFLLLPLVFAIFLPAFPIGVVLYWITTNLWSLGQYLAIVKFSKADPEVVLPKDSKGRKKVITPKGAAKTVPANSAKGGSTTKAAPQAPTAAARRNKRRR
ncbi:MAG: YidC/Oxa1 family rane protein insertase [Thermoleophilia bacterium]|nr:YidC/Oxa1 family rane protein insertase [Thermoleophilia bacterium]